MLRSKQEDHEADNVQLFRCAKCKWRRFYDQKREKETYRHPEYGLVTYKEAARLDIARHNCERYLEAKERAFQAAIDFKAYYRAERVRSVHYDWRQPVIVRKQMPDVPPNVDPTEYMKLEKEIDGYGLRELESDSGNMGDSASHDNAELEGRS